MLVLPALLYRRVRYGHAFRRIALTRCKYAIVDPEDFARLSKYKWLARQGQRTFYATGVLRPRCGKQKIVWMHREIMKAPDNMFVDHINHNGLDNRKANLRLATRSQNMWNRQKTTIKTKSRYKGLSFHNGRKKPWSVRIRVNGESKFLGFFGDETEAAKAYDRSARKYHGQFAVLNFGEESTR